MLATKTVGIVLTTLTSPALVIDQPPDHAFSLLYRNVVPLIFLFSYPTNTVLVISILALLHLKIRTYAPVSWEVQS